ncbi:MAG TPA: hypothetical protein VF475_16925 [Sphingobium sp.]
MSLMDYLNTTLGSSTSTATTKTSLTSSSLDQLLGTSSSSTTSTADDVLNALANGTSTTKASGVTISSSAAIAAAAKEDKAKDAATLTSEIRATLDAQYAKSKTKDADLSEASPRALATIMQNESGSFSDAEVFAAKQEMRQRDRQAFLQVTANGFSLSSIQSYKNQMQSARTDMSAEEKAVRDAGL